MSIEGIAGEEKLSSVGRDAVSPPYYTLRNTCSSRMA